MEYQENMPKKGTYLALVIIGFCLGVIWGALSIAPFKRMNAAVAAGDSETAWANAKKIKIFFWIGVGVNVLCLIGMMANG